jgi:vacuolar-type H+-ATPase subunit F/Vma7
MPEELIKDNALAVMGDSDAVMGFQALGFKVYAFKEIREFASALEEIVNDKTGICLVQDGLYSALKDKINDYKNLALPIFIPFSKGAGTDLLDNIVKDIRIRATGAF